MEAAQAGVLGGLDLPPAKGARLEVAAHEGTHLVFLQARTGLRASNGVRSSHAMPIRRSISSSESELTSMGNKTRDQSQGSSIHKVRRNNSNQNQAKALTFQIEVERTQRPMRYLAALLTGLLGFLCLQTVTERTTPSSPATYTSIQTCSPSSKGRPWRGSTKAAHTT